MVESYFNRCRHNCGSSISSSGNSITGGGAAAFFLTAGKAALGGLEIAAVVGLTSGTIRAGTTAIDGGSWGDIGKSFATGFADGFFAGSVYAAGTMILSAGAFRIAGLFNNGYGWSIGLWQGGYQTPKTPGISIFTHQGGINGGRSFGLDLDMFDSLHFHSKIFGKGSVKTHRWMFARL